MDGRADMSAYVVGVADVDYCEGGIGVEEEGRENLGGHKAGGGEGLHLFNNSFPVLWRRWMLRGCKGG